MSALISFRHLRQSWIWSEMWVASPCWKEVKNSVPKSYRIESWKWCKNALPRLPKSTKLTVGSSIYHLVAAPIKVLWKILNRMLSSIKEFEEHHRWKVITRVLGSLFTFPSNLGMPDGNLVGIGGQADECLIGSLINLDKLGNSKWPGTRSSEAGPCSSSVGNDKDWILLHKHWYLGYWSQWRIGIAVVD